MNDMTKGNPGKQILIFMIPVLIGNLFQNFYNVGSYPPALTLNL